MASRFPPPPPLPRSDLEPPEPPASGSRRLLAWVAASVGLIGAVFGLLLWSPWSSRSARECGTVESARFGYCVTAPGWEYTTDDGSEELLAYDELLRQTDSATVRIVATRLREGEDLDVVVQTVRSIETEVAVVDVGEVVPRRVAGVPAAQWDITLESDTVSRRVREVVFVRDRTAWRVQLLAHPDGFDARSREFEAILRSWTFT